VQGVENESSGARKMKALSVRQPWAFLIACGIKDIENRSWETNYRGRIYIHAGQRFDPNALIELLEMGMSLARALMLHSNQVARGMIIGEVDIVDCITSSNSKWFKGKFGWVLANPELYEKPIPYKGKLGLFNVELGE
jgi:hypothetical protein